MMNTKTLLEKTREFERQSRLADDKAKTDLGRGYARRCLGADAPGRHAAKTRRAGSDR